jgi:microcystin-dependent protein
MSDPFVGEIRPFPFNFAPNGWALCQGQLMPISQNTALFSLLGTFYGGDGRSTFALPNLQGQIAVGQGQAPGLSQYSIGDTDGTQTVTLLQTEMPLHGHNVPVSTVAGRIATPSPSVVLGATSRGEPPMYSATANALMSVAAGGSSGQNLPHNNMMPYLTISYCIALQGVFPSRS